MKECTYCGDELKGEDLENPEHDESGDVMCYDCYQEHYERQCFRCENYVNKSEMGSKVGELIAIWRPAPALGIDGKLPPGYYRVLEWPIYLDGMITVDFLASSLSRVADLDDKGKRAAEDTCYCGSSLCAECKQEIELLVTAPHD